MITKRKPSKVASKKATSKPTSAKAWSKKEDSTLIKMLNTGNSAVETAAVLGRTVTAVSNRKFNLKSTYKSASKKSFRSNTTPMVVKKAASTKKASGKVSATSKPVAKKAVKISASKPVAKKVTSKKATKKASKK